MKLEQLRPNIGELPEEEAKPLFIAYYNLRAIDLSHPIVSTRKPGRSKKPKDPKEKALKLTVAQKAALKALGLI